mmetsp:Transcript_10120/g.11538  ORF Transcript_10120/g.11538 Transcript_10120/m.11538 type:complete len:134 (+) Transcript_10120:40-441(+)|eukprot:CAMPEP_0205829884 /NCGR_PEP_ID=MMETSP0206-20130828/39500_1 /ASSEMBLY_ACC=CAM_ASM_000279 /TAXON_ID=36767 /ORGANISM="Euplotes focardii, Strain TN1" /LENGTH=133 /DNA_ID=CAMNT_0053133031 /DNA_START=30 /DNA_END=431 /DNA_ORIENTATION=+
MAATAPHEGLMNPDETSKQMLWRLTREILLANSITEYKAWQRCEDSKPVIQAPNMHLGIPTGANRALFAGADCMEAKQDFNIVAMHHQFRMESKCKFDWQRLQHSVVHEDGKLRYHKEKLEQCMASFDNLDAF